jgi:hypothetical protein
VAYVKRGFSADLGGFWSPPWIIGWRKVMELMMTGRFMSAEAHAATPHQLPAAGGAQPTMSGGSKPARAAALGKMLAYHRRSDFRERR